jgi:membrane associated rhomboid family serine protease
MRETPGYRRASPAAPWSPTVALLVALGVIFAIQTIVGVLAGIPLGYMLGLSSAGRGLYPLDPLTRHFALSLAGVESGQVWQLFTFQFLHGGLFHIALNGITLYSFGRFMEQAIGRGRFLKLYFISGTLGGVLQIGAAYLLHQSPDIPVVGASAGIAGLLGAFTIMYPHHPIVLFPIPFRIAARTLLWVALGISLIGTILPFGGIAHAAHLGGLVAGIGYVFLLRRPRRERSTYTSSAAPPFISSSAAPPRLTESADFIAREVDPILDKIATQGIHSLTDREKKILEAARSKMRH